MRSAKLEELAERRVELAREYVRSLHVMYRQGLATPAELLLAYREVAVAARDSGLVGEKLRRELAVYRDEMVELERMIEGRAQVGGAGPQEVEHAREALAEADYWLEEANERSEASPGK